MNCPFCEKEIEEEWIYCYFCGRKLRESNVDETYSRVLAMYESEQERRQALESKAATYIGLTSVMVTVLLVVGNLLFSPKIEPNFSSTHLSYLLFGSYVCAVAGFTSSAVFAFRAYHTGSVFSYRTPLIRVLNVFLERVVGKEVYEMIDPKKVLQFTFSTPEDAKRELLKVYSRVWKKNHELNNHKSDHILVCYALSSISLITIALTAVIVLVVET